MRIEVSGQARPIKVLVASALALSLLGVSACASKQAAAPPITNNAQPQSRGFHLFGSRPASVTPDTAIGVNFYLWRASLDVLNFMPLASADPYGGLIVTDWYVNPEKADERFKVNVYILDTRLRADGVNVSVNRQVKGADGQWVNAPTSAQTEEAIEEAILTKARAIRVGQTN